MADSWVELGVDHPPLVGGWVSYPIADRPQSLVDDFLVLSVIVDGFIFCLCVHPHDCFYHHPLSIIEIFSYTHDAIFPLFGLIRVQASMFSLHYWATSIYLGTARSSFLGINIGLCDGLAH